MKITKAEDLKEGDVMVLGGWLFYVQGIEEDEMDEGQIYTFVAYAGMRQGDHVFFQSVVQDLMDHGIQFERRG